MQKKENLIYANRMHFFWKRRRYGLIISQVKIGSKTIVVIKNAFGEIRIW
jgi:hypothetical protein